MVLTIFFAYMACVFVLCCIMCESRTLLWLPMALTQKQAKQRKRIRSRGGATTRRSCSSATIFSCYLNFYSYDVGVLSLVLLLFVSSVLQVEFVLSRAAGPTPSYGKKTCKFTFTSMIQVEYMTWRAYMMTMRLLMLHAMLHMSARARVCSRQRSHIFRVRFDVNS